MVAVPEPIAVTIPVWLTVATLVLLDDQVMFLLVAFDGVTVATSVALDEPTSKLSVFRSSETPVTAIVATLTVTAHVSVKPPSSVVTVIVAVPEPAAATAPVWLTVATLVLLDDQVTFLLVAFDGVTVATSFALDEPIAKLSVFRSSETPVTATVPLLQATSDVNNPSPKM
jgi:hypothetical protein